jgi:hypothetical protein
MEAHAAVRYGTWARRHSPRRLRQRWRPGRVAPSVAVRPSPYALIIDVARAQLLLALDGGRQTRTPYDMPAWRMPRPPRATATHRHAADLQPRRPLTNAPN